MLNSWRRVEITGCRHREIKHDILDLEAYDSASPSGLGYDSSALSFKPLVVASRAELGAKLKLDYVDGFIRSHTDRHNHKHLHHFCLVKHRDPGLLI